MVGIKELSRRLLVMGVSSDIAVNYIGAMIGWGRFGE